MVLTGADIFAEVLVEQGVETLFGYPGGAVLNLYDALYKYSGKIRHIMTAHEQGAAHAADGYARATGKTGVVLATSGPGATKPCHGHRHGIYGQHPHGGDHRQRRHQPHRAGQLSGGLYRGHYDAHYKA